MKTDTACFYILYMIATFRNIIKQYKHWTVFKKQVAIINKTCESLLFADAYDENKMGWIYLNRY